MNQLQIHKRIDDFFKAEPVSSDINIAQKLIGYNEDSKRYFFTIANEIWLKWISESHLFDDLKKKSVIGITYSYRLPELEYLIRMTEKEPKMVADIIISTPISKETLNPEVIDRFFWITGLLPVEQIKRILPKIFNEEWVKLMAKFGRSGYEYKKMVEKLNNAKDYESLIILSKVILTVRAKEEFANSEQLSISDKFFYLNDVSETGIFEAILNQENPKKEELLKICLDTLVKVINLGKDKDSDNAVFDKIEPFYLLDVNIFKLDLDVSRHYSREDIQNFVACCKKLVQDILESNCDNEVEAKRIYNTYIKSLPNTRICWKLTLYAITRCPNIFKNEIQNALFRFFNVGEKYYELDDGAEYHESLIVGFGVLSDNTQREYVTEVVEYYGAILKDKDIEKWRKNSGLKILFFIKNYLTPNEVVKIESIFGKIPEDEKIFPHPSMGPITSGFISDQSPFDPSKYTIEELVKLLKTDATPKAIYEKYKEGSDFLKPINAEGLGEKIKEDFRVRKTEYFAKINMFFDRNNIDAGYVYAILRQIQDMFQLKEKFTNEQYIQILNFFDAIRLSGEAEIFEKSEKQTYLADWITVHKVMADVLLNILGTISDSIIFKDNKNNILSLIKYLLSIKSSPDVEDNSRELNEPAFVALNSVRGQAYRAFVQFTYNEGKKGLSDDVKNLYIDILNKETSNAVRFTVGQFLASFYFRDVEFIKGLLPKIFPKGEVGKEKIYFATWEGYLTSSLYKELFDELKDYYEYSIKLNSDSYPKRKYLKGLDESLAIHMALAYAHFDFKIGDPLFNLFWETLNETRRYEFVSFIGRSCITRGQAGDEWFEENKVSKDKLIAFWNWIITTDVKIEPKVFSGFGFWINPDVEIIDEKIVVKNLAITLKKSEGAIDWDHGMIRRLNGFAKIDPVNTLDIIKNFLLLNGELNPNRRVPLFALDNEIKEALSIIYMNESLKNNVEDLINLLIEKGSSIFWGLKDIIK